MGQCVIRKATGDDIPAMLRMAKAFHEASGSQVSFDPDYIGSSIRSTIVVGDRLALVLDAGGEAHGMLCAAISRSVIEPIAQAHELVFWIDVEHRGRHALAMVRAYADWAKAEGCARAFMVSLPGLSLDKLYGRAGFEPAETVFSRTF